MMSAASRTCSVKQTVTTLWCFVFSVLLAFSSASVAGESEPVTTAPPVSKTTRISFLPGGEGTLAAWLFAGPFSASQPAIEDLAATSKKGQKPFPPFPHDTATARLNTALKWQFVNAGVTKAIDLTPLINGRTGKNICYLFSEIDVPVAHDTVLVLSASGSARWWLDDALLPATMASRDPRFEQSVYRAKLTAGRHRLLIRVDITGARGVVWVGAMPSSPRVADAPPSPLRQSIRVPSAAVANGLLAYAPAGKLLPKPRFIDKANRLNVRYKLPPGLPIALGTLRLQFGASTNDPKKQPPWIQGAGKAIALDQARAKGVSCSGVIKHPVTWSRKEVAATLFAGDTPIATTTAPVFSETNLLGRLQTLTAASAVLANAKNTKSELALALARLSIEQAGLLSANRLRRTLVYGEGLSYYLAQGERALAAAPRGQDPLQGLTGMVERAYLCATDGSVQPYRSYIPHRIKTLSKDKKKLPLLVILHGYVPRYTKLRWVTISDSLGLTMERLGMIAVLPFGRSNTDFLSIGEVDVLRVIAEMKRLYPVDEQRIYLAGYSMGGSGAWTLLSHYPDVFAAAKIWSGRTDYYYWHAQKLAFAGIHRRSDMPFFKRVLIDTDNPYHLTETLRSIPIRVKHPVSDALVKAGHTVRIAKKLRPPLGALRAEIPANGSHWTYTSEMDKSSSYAWMMQHSTASPNAVEHITYTPKYGRKHWLRIDKLKTWGTAAHIKASLNPVTREITIQVAKNIASLSILSERLPTLTMTNKTASGKYTIRFLPENPEVKIKISFHAAPDDRLATVLFGAEEKRPLAKTKNLSGPVKEAFNQPFLLVIGTAGDAAADKLNAANAKQFVDDWQTFARGIAPQKNDTEVTMEDIRGKNLILFGSPTSNAQLAAIAEKLPFRFHADGYGVGDKRIIGDNLGLLGVYPNPKNPKRYAVIIDGLFYGKQLSFNHKWDLVPDFIIFGTETDSYDGTNTARLAGFFDPYWQFDASLVNAPAPPRLVPQPE